MEKPVEVIREVVKYIEKPPRAEPAVHRKPEEYTPEEKAEIAQTVNNVVKDIVDNVVEGEKFRRMTMKERIERYSLKPNHDREQPKTF